MVFRGELFQGSDFSVVDPNPGSGIGEVLALVSNTNNKHHKVSKGVRNIIVALYEIAV